MCRLCRRRITLATTTRQITHNGSCEDIGCLNTMYFFTNKSHMDSINIVLCRIPHIVSLFVVAPCIICSAARGMKGERVSTCERVFESLVGHALILSFLDDTYHRRLRSPCCGAVYTTLVAGLLLHVSWMGNRTSADEYRIMGIGAVLYALYHISSLSLHGHSIDSRLPRHPLRRFSPCYLH